MDFFNQLTNLTEIVQKFSVPGHKLDQEVDAIHDKIEEFRVLYNLEVIDCDEIKLI